MRRNLLSCNYKREYLLQCCCYATHPHPYGGVVPELASRAHQQHILPVVDKALNDAKIAKKTWMPLLSRRDPVCWALLVGTSFAKSMALGSTFPLIEINHMQAHVLAHFIEDPKPAFPFLCLIESGGHTQIVKVTGPLQMEIIGETRDDAVGEAFDKTAKLLDLPYPGGSLIDKYASAGNPQAYPFPLPEMPGLDFSFSGIKTSFLYFLQKQVRENPEFIPENIADICASIQYTLIDILLKKLKKAARETGIREIA